VIEFVAWQSSRLALILFFEPGTVAFLSAAADVDRPGLRFGMQREQDKPRPFQAPTKRGPGPHEAAAASLTHQANAGRGGDVPERKGYYRDRHLSQATANSPARGC
jgi:hypothetical protein